MLPGRKDYGFTDDSSRNDRRNYGTSESSRVGFLIHTTSGRDSLEWLLGGAARGGNPASADYLVERTGHIHRLTREGYYAYHAGVSYFEWGGQGYTGDEVSNLLYGIELECLDTESPTLYQYDALGQLIEQIALDNAWKFWYPILGHYAVARPRGRRVDPVNFDWGELRRYMADSAHP